MTNVAHQDGRIKLSEWALANLHLPIMEPNGLITSVWHNGVVFCPREGEVALLMITRRFDSAELLRQKSESGSAVPMGAPLI